MNLPPSRNAGVHATTSAGGGCYNGACMFFSQGCYINCPCNEDNNFTDFANPCGAAASAPTNNDPAFLTFTRPTYPGDSRNWTANHPWRAPGTAVPLDACGLAGGSTKNNDAAGGYGNITVAGEQGFPGSRLPPVARPPTWAAGSVVNVSWAISANHGGGYVYRLCSADEELTEACFQQTILPFEGETSWLRWADGHEVAIPAVRLGEGTHPAGSVWTRNPIPACSGMGGGYQNTGCEVPQFAPPPGCNETCWGYQPCDECATVEMPAIVDSVRLPADLSAGDYVVSWRWDTEQTMQVWNGCGDVTVAA